MGTGNLPIFGLGKYMALVLANVDTCLLVLVTGKQRRCER